MPPLDGILFAFDRRRLVALCSLIADIGILAGESNSLADSSYATASTDRGLFDPRPEDREGSVSLWQAWCSQPAVANTKQ